METKLYGVSSGDGDSGVSHMFADYYVRTDEPWRLAKLAAATMFKPEFQCWAKENVQVDGDAECVISAFFYFMPYDDEDCERDYCPLIIEVFPEDKPCEGKLIYDSLLECFGGDVKLVEPETA